MSAGERPKMGKVLYLRPPAKPPRYCDVCGEEIAPDVETSPHCSMRCQDLADEAAQGGGQA